MNRYANTPFVRYRHGTEINIQVSIKDSIEIFIKAYRGDGEQSFNKLIADIADGSGAGISMESTWFQAIRELFDHLREYPPAVQVQVKNQYIDVLQILCESEFSEDAWNGIKTYFDQNMDTLSLWHFSHFKSMLMRSSPYRDKDGNVYDRETINNEEIDVQVIDGQTLAEARYSFITEDIYSKYGSIGLLLRFCRLVFIENSITHNTDDYSIIKFIMSEDSAGYNTWFLQGYWQVNAARFARTIRWHPKDYYTDLSWLESDLSLLVAKSADHQAQETTHPDAPVMMEETDQNLYQKSVEGYKFQYEVALDTNVFISIENGELPDEVFVEFEGRLIRWVNGSLHRYPVLVIPTNDDTHEDAMQMAQRFVSMIIFDNPYISMRESTRGGHPANYYPKLIYSSRLPSITSISSEWINHTSMTTTLNTWSVLSFYKEAKNSESVFYQFLNYYKIVQSAFLNANGSEDSNACVEWIDQQLQTMIQSKNVIDIFQDAQNLKVVQGSKLTVGRYLQHAFRDSASHVGKLTKRVSLGYPTINPDNLFDRRRYRTAISVIEELARKIIEKGMQK